MDSRGYHLAKKAREETPIADRSKITADLGATLKSERMDKRGRVRRRYSYSPTQAVYAIVNWRRKKAGQPPVPRGEMAAAAKALIVSRLRVVGSLRAGWSRAVAIFGAKIRQATNREGPRIKQQSTARTAQPGFNPSVEMEYRLVIDGNKIDPRVVQAAQRAFDREKAEMMAQLDKRLNGIAREAGAL